MKKKVLFLFVIILVFITVGCSANRAEPENKFLTYSEATNIIYDAAVKYNDELSKESLEQLYIESSKDEKNDYITKPEAFSMMLYAFELNTPAAGNNKRIGIFDLKNDDEKINNNEDFDKFLSLGILTQDEISDLNTITSSELNRILSKIYTYIGTNKKDDFYTSVNKEWLENSEIPPGYSSYTNFLAVKFENDKKIENIINSSISSNAPKGSPSQKIGDFYKSFVNIEKRNSDGLKPLEKYMNMIHETETIDELLTVDSYFSKNLGIETLSYFFIMNDAKDSSVNALYYLGLPIPNNKSDYVDPSEGFADAYKEYLNTILGFLNEDGEYAEEIINLENRIASNSLDPKDSIDVDNYYNPYEKKELGKMFNGIDFEKMVENYGFDKSNTIIVYDEGAVKTTGEILVEENLDELKALSKVNLYRAFENILTEDHIKASETFRKKRYGISGEKTLNQKAIDYENSLFPDYIGQIYVEKYFSKAAKEDVEKMVNEFINEYKIMLEDNDWLGEKTKEKAIEKLLAMRIKVGYPDEWDDSLAEAIVSEDNLFNNVISVNVAKNKKRIEDLYKPVDKDKWSIPVQTVNAFYDPANNEIVFPAAILQGVFYDVNRPKEENLGGIGMAIAHEITHSFDNNGSKYDKNGNANEWWTEEDKANFQEQCEEMIKIFDGIEIIPGIFSDGNLTLSENIADLGGLKCALQVCLKDENADIKKFFESNAVIWRYLITREQLENYSKNDVHAPNKLRVNIAFGNIDEFYTTFDVKEVDHMFIPETDRVTIW